MCEKCCCLIIVNDKRFHRIIIIQRENKVEVIIKNNIDCEFEIEDLANHLVVELMADMNHVDD